MEKILIIEDNDEINNLLKEMLLKEKYQVRQAFSGPEGLLYASQEAFSLCLLDLMLPGMRGEDVLEKIRESSKIPVIVISAKTDIDGKVELLQNGANDYITKPFDTREVMARVRIQLQGRGGVEEKKTVYRELELDAEKHVIFVNGEELSLTKQEYNILELLMKHPDKIYSKQELFELAWDEYYVGVDKTLNVHISNIRKKIKCFSEREYIDTVWGIGFRLKK